MLLDDKTIITIPDTTELSKDFMKNPCAYVHDNETIGICDATQKEIVLDSDSENYIAEEDQILIDTNKDIE